MSNAEENLHRFSKGQLVMVAKKGIQKFSIKMFDKSLLTASDVASDDAVKYTDYNQIKTITCPRRPWLPAYEPLLPTETPVINLAHLHYRAYPELSQQALIQLVPGQKSQSLYKIEFLFDGKIFVSFLSRKIYNHRLLLATQRRMEKYNPGRAS